jgi:hypothetical protein
MVTAPEKFHVLGRDQGLKIAWGYFTAFVAVRNKGFPTPEFHLGDEQKA